MASAGEAGLRGDESMSNLNENSICIADIAVVDLTHVSHVCVEDNSIWFTYTKSECAPKQDLQLSLSDNQSAIDYLSEITILMNNRQLIEQKYSTPSGVWAVPSVGLIELGMETYADIVNMAANLNLVQCITKEELYYFDGSSGEKVYKIYLGELSWSYLSKEDRDKDYQMLMDKISK